MNDEIKEIDRIIINVKRKLQFSPDRRFVELFNKEDIQQLLDYITNLQEENERLKELVNPKTQIFIDTQDMEERYGEELYKEYLEKQVKDYKSRIEKAVEYIENTPLYETTYDYNMEEELEIQNVSDETASNKLLDILNGKE